MPAYPSGTVEQQVLQQYSYLFQMAQQLNLALEAAESSRTAAVQAAGKSRAAQGTEQEYQNLKSLIIKTADTVQRRMDQLFGRGTAGRGEGVSEEGVSGGQNQGGKPGSGEGREASASG